MEGPREPLASLGDDELVALFRQGDAGAFPELARRYARPLLNFLHGYVADLQRAEDLTQDVLVAVHGNLDRYRPAPSFAAWIFRIARNLALNVLRRRRREKRALESLDRDDARDPGPPAEKEEIAARVRRAVDALPEMYRDAVVLCDMNGLTYLDAARALGVSEKALGARLARGRAMLRERLRGRVPLC